MATVKECLKTSQSTRGRAHLLLPQQRNPPLLPLGKHAEFEAIRSKFFYRNYALGAVGSGSILRHQEPLGVAPGTRLFVAEGGAKSVAVVGAEEETYLGRIQFQAVPLFEYLRSLPFPQKESVFAVTASTKKTQQKG
jgi:hypothetical protein